MAGEDGRGQQSSGGSGVDVRRWAPPAVLAAILLAFALANTQRTTVDFVFTEQRAPLFLVLLVTALLGAVVGALVRRFRD